MEGGGAGLIFLASHVYERREKTRGEEEEEWRGEGDQDVRPRLPLPASAAAQVYRWLVSHQVSAQVGEEEEEEDTKKTGRRNHIQVVDERQTKKDEG